VIGISPLASNKADAAHSLVTMNLDLQNPIYQGEETFPFNPHRFWWTQIGWTNQLVALPAFNSYWRNNGDEALKINRDRN
jgi:hypothetical protein